MRPFFIKCRTSTWMIPISKSGCKSTGLVWPALHYVFVQFGLFFLLFSMIPRRVTWFTMSLKLKDQSVYMVSAMLCTWAAGEQSDTHDQAWPVRERMCIVTKVRVFWVPLILWSMNAKGFTHRIKCESLAKDSNGFLCRSCGRFRPQQWPKEIANSSGSKTAEFTCMLSTIIRAFSKIYPQPETLLETIINPVLPISRFCDGLVSPWASENWILLGAGSW